MPELMDVALVLILLVLMVQSILNSQGMIRLSLNTLLSLGAVLGLSVLFLAQLKQLPETKRTSGEIQEVYHLEPNASWQDRWLTAIRVLRHQPDQLDSTKTDSLSPKVQMPNPIEHLNPKLKAHDH